MRVRTIQDYQRIFDERYVSLLGNHELNNYTRMMMGLEAAFAEAGYNDITVDELGGHYHDPLVMYSESTDVVEIAGGFCMMLAARLQKPLQDRMALEIPWGLTRCNNPVLMCKMDLAYLQGEVNWRLKAKRIRRGTKRYKKLISDTAGQAAKVLRQAAGRAIAKAATELEAVIAETEEGNDTIRQGIRRLERTRRIVEAFRAISGVRVGEGWGIDGLLTERRAGLKKALDARVYYTERVRLRHAETTPDMVVDDSLRQDRTDEYRDLKALWEAGRESGDRKDN